MARSIPVDEVIAEACSMMEGVSDEEKVFMRQWAYTAQRRIGFGKMDRYVSQAIEINDWSFTKPDNLVKTNDLALFNAEGLEIVTSWKGSKSGYPSENVTGRIHQDLRGVIGAIGITESANYYNVDEFTSDDTGLYLIVDYYGVPMDQNGLPLIPEHCTLAVIFYIQFVWSKKKHDNRSEIEQNYRMWLMERKAASALSKTPDMIEGKAIARTINSMIQKPVIDTRQY